jgi:hypothetical protein
MRPKYNLIFSGFGGEQFPEAFAKKRIRVCPHTTGQIVADSDKIDAVESVVPHFRVKGFQNSLFQPPGITGFRALRCVNGGFALYLFGQPVRFGKDRRKHQLSACPFGG